MTLHTLRRMATSREPAPAARAHEHSERAPCEESDGRRDQRQRAPYCCNGRYVARVAGGDRRDDRADRPAPLCAPVRGDAADPARVAEVVEYRLSVRALLHREPPLSGGGTAGVAAADNRADGRAVDPGRVRQRRRAPVRRTVGARDVVPDSQGQLLCVGRVHGDPRPWTPTVATGTAARRLQPFWGL